MWRTQSQLEWTDYSKKLPHMGLLIRSKIRLPKMEHPEFEGHVMLNEDEYQKSVPLKFT